MSPDRGSPRRSSTTSHVSESDEPSRAPSHEMLHSEPSECFLAIRSEQPQFTPRALVLGLVIGVLIAFSNTYFGLQTGWISGMAMPSALIGFAYFKGLRALMSGLGEGFGRLGWGEGFSEVENVLVQTVAGSVGTMPLGCGFVGVIPALEYLLKPGETPREMVADPGVINVLAVGDKTGGFQLPLSKLVLWALGICFFGVVFAVPLRKEVIVREKLKFPSGTATALMISVLHGGEKGEEKKDADREEDEEEGRALIDESNGESGGTNAHEQAMKQDWKRQIRLLTTSFGVSGAYTLISYFIPQLHALPIFGTYLSNKWLWELNPSPAYVGQGIIMGPATTIHMLLGAILGWGVLSPLAKHQGWASGDVGDWNTGSKGWIVWISLAIMLADAIIFRGVREHGLKNYLLNLSNPKMRGYSPVNLSDDPRTASKQAKSDNPPEEEEHDAPPEHLIGVKTTVVGAILSLTFCVVAVRIAFNAILSIPLTLYALVLALLLSIMGVRALGETDLNPVSGISKLTQLLFAFVTPSSNPNAVVINLLAGAISEAGALQAGDLLQDLKTGHLLGASPKAQFWGQLIGSAVGAVVSACVYKLYTAVYTIPSGMFQVPTAYVWVFTARLVTGSGLPPHAPVFAGGAAAVFAVLTIVRIYGNARKAWWVSYVPGGIAVAVGMYNTPSFTLARTAGGVLAWWWTTWKGRAETPVIVLASGLILGEGLFSIVNLGLASGSVGHL
ncbi:OPT superfamily [Oleoguttula sp. CCFEE 5521]